MKKPRNTHKKNRHFKKFITKDRMPKNNIGQLNHMPYWSLIQSKYKSIKNSLVVMIKSMWRRFSLILNRWESWVASAGFLLTALVLFPRITVEAGQPSLASNLLTSPFTIANTGFTTLRNVEVGVSICTVKPMPLSAKDICDYSEESVLLFKPWFKKSMILDERHSVVPDDVIRYPRDVSAMGADIGIFISYSPWYLPLRLHRTFRFRTALNSDSSYRWAPTPLE